MRLAALALALHDPADELDGTRPREQLEAMNEHFSAALNRAFELGLESRKSAASQVALPTSRGPRLSAPLCPATWEALLRSATSASVVAVRR